MSDSRRPNRTRRQRRGKTARSGGRSGGVSVLLRGKAAPFRPGGVSLDRSGKVQSARGDQAANLNARKRRSVSLWSFS
jgi:hypothetical protein